MGHTGSRVQILASAPGLVATGVGPERALVPACAGTCAYLCRPGVARGVVAASVWVSGRGWAWLAGLPPMVAGSCEWVGGSTVGRQADRAGDAAGAVDAVARERRLRQRGQAAPRCSAPSRVVGLRLVVLLVVGEVAVRVQAGAARLT